jgi:hypothetical protein
MIDSNDMTQIGLSAKMHPHLVALKEEGYFAQMRDAYRFAIAVAITNEVIPPELQNRQNVFAIPTVDSDGSLAVAIRTLVPGGEISPYRWAERLAEAGIEILADKMAQGKLDIGAMLVDAENAAMSDVPEMG